MKKKFYIAVLVASLSVILWIGGMAYMFIYRINPLSREFLNTQRSIKEAEGRLTQFDKIVSKAISRSSEKIERVEKLLYEPSENSALEFVRFVENLAGGHNLTYDVLSAPSGGSPAEARLSVRGTFSNAALFLRELENGKYLARVKNISLNASGPDVNIVITLLILTI